MSRFCKLSQTLWHCQYQDELPEIENTEQLVDGQTLTNFQGNLNLYGRV